MLIGSLLILAGIAVLILSADRFVHGASDIARRLNVAPLIVGVLIVGFGTSAPELLVATLAAAHDAPETALGSVVGSNVANLSLIAGLAALILPLAVSSSILRREAPMALIAVIVSGAAMVGGVQRWEALGCLLVFLVMALLIVRVARSATDAEMVREVEEFTVEAPTASWTKVIGLTLAGLVGTIAGAEAFVKGAEHLADALGVADGVIGLTVVALGTSLPEVATALSAARKGEGELVIGNILGSNIFNSLLIVGIASLITPTTSLGHSIVYVAVPASILISVVAVIAMRHQHRLSRWEGAVLILLYCASLPLLLLV